MKLTVSSEKGDSGTLSASTSSTADTVDIILRVVRIVIVEDMSDVLNVFLRLAFFTRFEQTRLNWSCLVMVQSCLALCMRDIPWSIWPGPKVVACVVLESKGENAA